MRVRLRARLLGFYVSLLLSDAFVWAATCVLVGRILFGLMNIE